MEERRAHERRKNLRVPFETQLFVRNLGNGTEIKAEGTRDLSMKGLFCFCKTPLPEETPVVVRLVLTGTSSELSLRIEGHVVRREEQGMAIFFDSMDLDAFIHLKNILYFNSGDPERIDKELSDL
ncbi:MAG: PilZ domain-containing protein [Thermodesulfatator sp.]|nr:MAG: PilZ domain-containing protein [Thermodesulfatator sp.]